jgi:type VI secretion system protein ImpK
MARPLILLMTQIRHSASHSNVEGFRIKVMAEIKNFESKLTALNYPEQSISEARYCLCTALDEAVLSQLWGRNSIWVQASLLSTFHRETWGGERFYILLEKAFIDPKKNIDFIELAYFLLSLGFEGKLFGDENKVAHTEIRQRIFNLIKQARSTPTEILFTHLDNVHRATLTQNKRKLLLPVALISLAILSIAIIFYNLQMYGQSKSTIEALSQIARTSPLKAFTELKG